MRPILAQILIIAASIGLFGCQTGPNVPNDIGDQSVIIMGFTTHSAQPYEGGTLYTGFIADKLDGRDIKALTQSQFVLVTPGEHRLEGRCYWKLRGSLQFEDDFTEPGQLTLKTHPNTVYTIQSDIDEYKHQCKLRVVERPHP